MNLSAYTPGRRLDWPQFLTIGLLLAACAVLFAQRRDLDSERATLLAREQACRECLTPLPE